MNSTKPKFLIVALEAANNSFVSQVVITTLPGAMEVFTRNMAQFFIRSAEQAEGEVRVNDDVARFLTLVRQEKYDEAYGEFLAGAKKTAMALCGIYRYSAGDFVKQNVKVLKGSI